MKIEEAARIRDEAEAELARAMEALCYRKGGEMNGYCTKETKEMPLGRCCYKVKVDRDCQKCDYWKEIGKSV